MDEEDAFGGLVGGFDPAEQFVAVGVGGESVDAGDSGVNVDVDAEDAEGGGAVDEGAAAGAGGLVADEADEVAGVGCEALEVVEGAAAGEHATGGDDDPWAGEVVEFFGVFDGAVEADVAGEEGAGAGMGNGAVEVFALEVAVVEVGDVVGHG